MDLLLALISLLIGGTLAAAYVVGLIHLFGLTASSLETLGTGAASALNSARQRLRLGRPASELIPAGPPTREGAEVATPPEPA